MQHPYFIHLAKDPFFKTIMEGAAPRELKQNNNIPLFLYTSIINQQLSTKVGAVFNKRFLDLYAGIAPTAEQIINTQLETLQAIGLSKSKATYIKNVAQFDIDNGLGYDKLVEMTDEEVTIFITAIKGIGRWTAQIVLMFGLGREDVFSGDDLIIQKAMALMFNLDITDKKKFKADIHRLSCEWSPYRTHACLHLWHWYHNRATAI